MRLSLLLGAAAVAVAAAAGQATAQEPAAGSKPSFVLPLASPLGDPTKMFIPSWSFGNRQWDPKRGMPVDSGPSPDYRHSYLTPGSKAAFPPGTNPAGNPNLYIQNAPTGVNNGINAASLHRFRDTRLNADGVEVGVVMRRQMGMNAFPSEKPFNTNVPSAMRNGGLPLVANQAESMLEAGATVRARTALATDACVNCRYL